MFDWPPADYIPITYHDKPYPAPGDMVSVTVSEVTPNINQVLVHGSQFAGRLTASDTGLPMSNMDVNVFDNNGNSVSTGYTLPDGTYTTTPGLPSGNYRIQFSPPFNNINGCSQYGFYAYQFYRNKSTLATADPITLIAPQKISGVDAQLDPGGHISGTVIAADTLLPLECIDIEIYDIDGQKIWPPTGTGPTGAYVTPGLPTGQYRVKFIGWGPYATQYYNNKTTLDQADWITVTTPFTTTNINAMLALLVPTPPDMISITGPVTGVTVVPVNFSAAVGPLSATQPMTYVWSASGLSNVIHFKEGYQDDVQFSWPTTGTKFITVTVSNVSGSVTSNFTVTLEPAFQILLLQMFNGYYVPSSQLTP